MCGIAGIIDFRGRPIDATLLEAFCRRLNHRGPDDRGVWQHQAPGFSAGLAHTRLAVIDPTPEAHQPMTDRGGRRAVSYNGELYNYRELARELPAPMRTTSDTEVVLEACTAWGPDALTRFDAMWALAYVDVDARKGHLSRDPFGIKPLYYAHVEDRLVFASELTALRAFPGLPGELDRDALATYLTFGYVPHPQTIYQGVYKLPPGHRLDFDAEGPKPPVRFHRIAACGLRLAACGESSPADPQSAIRNPQFPPSYHDARRELRSKIERAVLSQRVADVPLGAFLSGGLDSSIVTACLARAGGERVKTFSIGYADHPRYDETDYAQLVARHLGTEHHAFRLTFRDVIETVEPMLGRMGEPFADSSLLPTALVSRHTREHVTVALSGDGGDELFGGYWRYLGHHYLEQYRRFPAFVRRGIVEPLLRRAPTARSTRWLDRVRQARKLLRGDRDDALDRHLAWSRILDVADARELLGEQAAWRATGHLRDLYRATAAALGPEMTEGWRDSGTAGSGFQGPVPPSLRPSVPLSRRCEMEDILLGDLGVSLPGDMLHKVDLASMTHSLEVRVPLLSREVVDFAAGLPVEYKLRGTTTKRILRDAFRDALPEPVLRRRKMGFEVPVGEFMRNELRELYGDTVTPAALGDLGLEPAAAQRLFDEHAARRQDHADALWALLVLCHWARART